jgi:hypothetical protein
MDRKRYVAGALALAVGLAIPTGAVAAANPSGTGLPSQSCEDQPIGPAGFNTDGFANAQSRYAPISQYDVACYRLSHRSH